MAVPNLTREDAAARAALLDVDTYTVELDLTDGNGSPGERTFGSRTTVGFSCASPGARSWIDLVAPKVNRAVLNGTELDLSGYTPETGIELPGLQADNELLVEADCEFMNTGEGLHRFVDPVDGAVYLYSQFETADAKRMFACFDQPDLKATLQFTVTAPASWRVITNAAQLETAETGSALRHRFAATKPMSTYLAALVAGPYAQWRDTYTDESGEIPLGIYCRASMAEFMDADRLFAETKQGFSFYHSNFGMAYPFGKYDQCFVPEFNAGAMENVGCITFREDYVFRSKVTGYAYERRAETVLHEMAHMWFGDLVTMKWWDDLWLNESFATWASVMCQVGATRYTDAWTTFASVEKSWAYRQDMLPSTHPVVADIPDMQAVEVNFDGITYAKGASVLKQLVAYVGEQNFLAGLRIYFPRHAYGNATLADLLAALEEASGRDLSGWSAQWLQTTGMNLLRARFEVGSDDRFSSFEVLQGPATPGDGELRSHRLAIGIYDDDGSGSLVRVHRHELDVDGERTAVPELEGVHRGKLVLVNDDDLTYCAMRMDPDSLATAIDRIGDFADPLPRTLCWSAAWEMTREAELKARDFVTLVLGGIASESQIGVVQRLLLQAQTALSFYTAPSWQHIGWRTFSDRMLELAQQATPGSDHQLAFVNTLAGSVLSEPHLSAIHGWLGGTAPLPGLEMDRDLRWRLIHALVAHGVVSAPEIDAEHAADNTASGTRQAERAYALRPTAEAKSTAWRRAAVEDDLPNSSIESIVSGFAHPSQHELLEPFAGTYFDEVDQVWQRRTSEAAQPVVVGLYPSWSISEESVAAADAWLAGEHPNALRRLVIEGRAGVVRALAARQFDGS